MRSLFRSKYRITQPFGPDHLITIGGKEMTAAQYYKQYGLAGHEGIDAVPTGSVLDVLCLEDGVVVRDTDDAPSGKNYGINVTVWHPGIRKATQYCHLSKNNVSLGEKVTAGQVLGIMGKTGNTTGPHVHLNLFEVDENGMRLNKDNGYYGGINPLPFLEETPAETSAEMIPVPRPQLEDFQRCKEGWNKVREKLNVEDSVTVVLAELDKLISYEDAVVEKDKQVAAAMAEASLLRSQMAEQMKVSEGLAAEAATLSQKASDLEKKYQSANRNYEAALKRIGELEHDLSTPDDAWTLIRKGIEKLFT